MGGGGLGGLGGGGGGGYGGGGGGGYGGCGGGGCGGRGCGVTVMGIKGVLVLLEEFFMRVIEGVGVFAAFFAAGVDVFTNVDEDESCGCCEGELINERVFDIHFGVICSKGLSG